MAPRDANWIDGLRGVASFVVVCGHLCTAFVPWLHSPAMNPGQWPKIFQFPFLRLVVGGRSAVALFFLITGYVNSIGPIGKSRAGNTNAAFTGIARSALARSGRLILPAMLATFISWLLATTNAYHMARHCDAQWIRQGFKGPERTLGANLKALAKAEFETWTIGWNTYDGTQWTLHLFLQGSMLVYTTMLATVLVRPRARLLVYGILYLYYWQQGGGHADGAIMGLNVMMGMFVAELHHHFKDNATSVLPTPIPACLIVIGMFCAGYPQDNQQNAKWSQKMQSFMRAIISESDYRRLWDHVGASTILLGIFFSRNARRVLTSPVFNFLGRVSFPVYLLHNTLIKSVLTWMIYLHSAKIPRFSPKGLPYDHARGSTFHVFVAVGIYFYILYRVAALWVQFIDPVFARIVNRATSWMCGEAPPAVSDEPILRRESGEQQKPKPNPILPP